MQIAIQLAAAYRAGTLHTRGDDDADSARDRRILRALGRSGWRQMPNVLRGQLPGTSARDGGVTGRLIIALFAVCARVAWVSEVDREHDSFVASRIDAVMCIGGAVQREWWRYGEGERSGTGHFGEVRRGLPLGWVWEIVAAE